MYSESSGLPLVRGAELLRVGLESPSYGIWSLEGGCGRLGWFVLRFGGGAGFERLCCVYLATFEIWPSWPSWPPSELRAGGGESRGRSESLAGNVKQAVRDPGLRVALNATTHCVGVRACHPAVGPAPRAQPVRLESLTYWMKSG
jgi:hypothetical protein